MNKIKKIGIIALFLTMLMSVNVFAEETTEDPWANYETIDPWENIPTEDVTYPEGYWGHPEDKCGVIVNVLDYGIEKEHELYAEYNKLIMKLVEADFEYHVYLEDANGNTYKAEVGSGMDWNYYLPLEPGTYTVTKVEWDPTNTEFVTMDSQYIYTNTVTFDTRTSDVLINLDLIRLINDSGALDKDIRDIKRECSKLLDYVFAGQDNPIRDPHVEEMTESNIVIPSGPDWDNNPTEEVTEPTLESEENETSPVEDETTVAADDEEEKKPNRGLEWLKNNIFTLVILVVVCVVWVVIVIRRKQKDATKN